MTRSKIVLIAALALALVVSTAGVAFADPLTKKEWRTAARGICSDANEEVIGAINEVAGDLGTDEEPSDEQLADIADAVAPIIQGAVDDVRDLEEPSSFKRGVKKWLGAIDDVVEEMQDDPSILDTPDPFKKPNKLAKKLGLRGCV
jgi:hypothetical protein